MSVRDIIPWRRKQGIGALAARDTFEDVFTGLQREINRMFDHFFDTFETSLAPSSMAVSFTPQVDVNETDTAVEVTAELPGLDEKDIDVSISDNDLILKGEKNLEKEDDYRGAHRIERSYGSFYRRIPVPVEINPDKIEASFARGVLKIVMPKAEPTKSKAIKVKVH